MNDPTQSADNQPKVTAYPTRAAWFAGRQEGAEYAIGGSAAGAVLGRSPWAGPWDIYTSQRSAEAATLDEDLSPGDVRQRGHLVEPWLMGWRSVAGGAELDTRLTVVEHPAEQWARCSPDGLVFDGDKIVGVIEGKSYSFHDRDRWASPLAEGAMRPMLAAPWVDYLVEGDGIQSAVELGIMPDKYVYQILWSFYVSGCAWVDVVAAQCGFSRAPVIVTDSGEIVTGGWVIEQERPVCIRITRPVSPVLGSANLAEWIGATVGAWRVEHLVGGAEPPPDASAACRRAAMARPRPGVSEATTEAIGFVAEYKAARDNEKAAKEAKAGASAYLLDVMKDNHTITVDDKTIAKITTDKRGRRSLRVS